MKLLLLVLVKPLFALSGATGLFYAKSAIQFDRAEAAVEVQRAEIEQLEVEIFPRAEKGDPVVPVPPPAPEPKVEDAPEQPED